MSTTLNESVGATTDAESMAYLDVRELQVEFTTEDGVVRAVDGVSYSVERGRTLAIVGESGSGKSVTNNAVMGLLPKRNTRITGQAFLDGEDLISASPEYVRSLRGGKMAMVFQDPLSSLHPFYKIGRQLVEATAMHQKLSKSAAKARAVEMLERVGIPNAKARFDAYPHEMSGGMRQRVMIAMALMNDPQLIIADEPTTALDVTVQAQIIDLLKDLQAENGAAIVLITHDLGVVADMADEVVVMYGGRVVERAAAPEVYYNPQMPYTWGLIGSIPRMDIGTHERLTPIPGSPPSLLAMPKGCVFRPRCAFHQHVPGGRCDTERPELRPVAPGHLARCHLDAQARLDLRVQGIGEHLASVQLADDAVAEDVDDAGHVTVVAGESAVAEPPGATDDVAAERAAEEHAAQDQLVDQAPSADLPEVGPLGEPIEDSPTRHGGEEAR
jgi:peptide/nickel transport system ATP-binding protein